MTVRDDHLEGKYEILEKLGEGGMGAVYKARHRLLDEIRVIKVMRAGLKGDEDLEKRFFQEARVASRLRHPNVAQLFDFTLDDDGTAYIVMEFIDGQTFEEIVEHRGPMEIGLAIELALQSLRAIEYLHRMNFVHRDIAPDNLMLTKDTDGRPLVKLIDLGITKSIAGDSGLTATGMFLGKFKYTSPEQLSASPTQAIDGRADLYSFGVVLYELVSGQSPISGDTPPAMIGGHLFRPPIPFAETDPEGQVPPGLRSLIMEALEKDPQQRIPSAVEFSQRLVGLQAKYPYAGALGTDLVQVPKEARADASQVGESTQRRLDRHFAPELADSPEQSMAGAEVLPQQPAGSFDSTSGATRIPGVVPGSPPAGPSAPSAPSAPAPSTSATTVSGAWPVSAKPPSAVSSPASARGPLPSPETPG
ncbi:MAG: serine/threonine-protein kinase, partial [Acidobacteriota bacterium]